MQSGGSGLRTRTDMTDADGGEVSHTHGERYTAA